LRVPNQTIIIEEPITIVQPYYIATYADQTVVVTASALNVRSGPGYDFPIIGLLDQGDGVIIYGYDTSSEWLYVQLPSGDFGWILAHYTAPLNAFQCG